MESGRVQRDMFARSSKMGGQTCAAVTSNQYQEVLQAHYNNNISHQSMHTQTHIHTHCSGITKKSSFEYQKNNNLASVKKRTIAKIFLKNFENTHKNFDPSSSFEVHMRWHRFHAPNAPWPPFLAAKLSSDQSREERRFI